MNTFWFNLRELFSEDNVAYFPCPYCKGKWRTADGNLYNSYESAVTHSKEKHLERVVVRHWNETTQSTVYAKTYW